MRDEFTEATKNLLRQRVGNKCSNPACRASTSGPCEGSENQLNGGDAAHIYAASPKGKRYNPNMTTDERKDFNNGIWLCKSCAWKIDHDDQYYTAELIYNWKTQAEKQASVEWNKPVIQAGYFDIEKELNKGRDFLELFNEFCDTFYYPLYKDGRHMPKDYRQKLLFLNSKLNRNWHNQNPLWSFNPSINAQQSQLIGLLDAFANKLRMQNWLLSHSYISNQLEDTYEGNKILLDANDREIIEDNKNQIATLLTHIYAFGRMLNNSN